MFFAPTVAVAMLAPVAPGAEVDYAKDVRPILAAHCYKCHGLKAQKGGLRVDTVAALLTGGDSGPAVVRGDAAQSRLARALTGADGLSRMPFNRPPLSDAQINTIKVWINAGAAAPAVDVPDDGKAGAVHWAFAAPVRPVPPPIRNAAGVRNAIDLFIRAKLDAAGLSPAPEADQAKLHRRLSLDLTGLPPTPAEMDAFSADTIPNAYERLVDRLLASPHYGERWGRHWLDVARYADSNGYSIDGPREIWRYRDWVIDALNRDLPFDRFAVEQIAGDLLPGATLANRVATGFHRNTPINQEGGIDPEQFRVEAVADRVNTTGVAFLGLTLGCCRCHDHKYDPLTQRDYYQLFAFFNNCDEPVLEFAPPEAIARRATVRAKLTELDGAIRKLEDGVFAALSAAEREAHREVVAIHDIELDQRTDKQRQALHKFLATRDASAKALVAEHKRLKTAEPKFDTTMVVAERESPRATHVMAGGDFTRPGARVEPGVPAVLPPLGTPSPNRLDFARWLVEPKNPLTARVTVNRAWQQLFGKGLVETENDFGTQGSVPSHPELLDWLATEFVARGWSLKELHRLIVTSATYRQDSSARGPGRDADPANPLLWRQNRLRLEAEAIRDGCLVAGGALTRKVGGPSVRPPQPEGVFKFTQVKREWVADQGPDRFRRGLYTFLWRAAPHPALTVFDSPDPSTTCTRRVRSNTPLQALTLLNDPAYVELAAGLARRVIAEGPANDTGRIRFAFRACLGRDPSGAETARLGELLAAERAGSARDVEPWMSVARVLFNLDEFITRE